MPAIKRKRIQEEPSQPPTNGAGLTHRLMRHPSMLLAPSKPAEPTPLRRALRASSGAMTNPDDAARAVPRGRGRPRRQAALDEADPTAPEAKRGRPAGRTADRESVPKTKLRNGQHPDASAKAASERKMRRPIKRAVILDSDTENASTNSGSDGHKLDGGDGTSSDDELPKRAKTVRRMAAASIRRQRPRGQDVTTAALAGKTTNKTRTLMADPNAQSPEATPEASSKVGKGMALASCPAEIRPAPPTPAVQKRSIFSPSQPHTAPISMSRTAVAANSTPTATPRTHTQRTIATVNASTPAVPLAPGPGQPDRNIDKVVLGKICFRAWYPSYYGKEVLGETSGNAHVGSKHGHDKGKGKGKGRGKGKDNHPGAHRQNQPILDRLYVCPVCFKYSKEIVPWWGHVQLCERQYQIPGEKIYVHPKGIRTVRVPVEPISKARRRRGGVEPEVQYVDRVVKDEGEWSVWEVDGEKDVLFCQNLSLFAKLFLDNKSVFFDVTGFHYFLLVYTPAPSTAPGAALEDGVGSLLRPRVVGFFSKEKMSWDNNNLACILVFPPWQRKGLGALLMGVSYEISRREEVLGGPEKPISDLGKKGYKRFWAGEIARWLLGLNLPATQPGGALVEDENEEKVLVIDTADCSRATYIAQEDCLLVLREMGIAEDAGMGPPKNRLLDVPGSDELTETEAGAHPSSPGAEAAGEDKAVGSIAVGELAAVAADVVALTASAAAVGGTATAPAMPKEVRRVRISKMDVRRWIAENRISLEKACDPAGFIKVYTKRDVQQAIDE